MTEIYKDNSETIGKTPLVRINRISQGKILAKLATESNANVPVVQDFGIQERMALASAAPQTPISQGQTDITVTIQAVFGIE